VAHLIWQRWWWVCSCCEANFSIRKIRRIVSSLFPCWIPERGVSLDLLIELLSFRVPSLMEGDLTTSFWWEFWLEGEEWEGQGLTPMYSFIEHFSVVHLLQELQPLFSSTRASYSTFYWNLSCFNLLLLLLLLSL